MPTSVDTSSVNGLIKSGKATVVDLPIKISNNKKDFVFRDCHHDFSISGRGREKITFRGEDLEDIQDSFKSLDSLIVELYRAKAEVEIVPNDVFSKIEIDAIKNFLLQLKPDIDLNFTLRFFLVNNKQLQENKEEEDNLDNLLI